MDTLRRLPALRVLDQLPVPVVAVTEKGTVLFANDAMGEMLGMTREAMQARNFTEVFETPLESDGAVAGLQKHANSLVRLSHADGSTVRAVMSRSALQRADDDIALVTFQDLTEQLWAQGR
ncbi:PAS domain-containing protein [Mycobacterium yunnanensis]|uniref:PAS domain-containing protein n=1 Tax=Mycobacterium yunnanensis TaxID=368477 RepID=A0A9X2Z5J0_9MYCO|nr:PAS domain-containing protein [Mycobacterium yunnanensis]MCV7422741.1 PAS domain-containing protein [Mycobacterium yunnanensis]